MSNARWFLLAIFTLLAAVGAMQWKERHPEWVKWQKRYNAEPGVTPIPIGIRELVPTRTGQPELCVTCHIGLEDISPAHPAQTFGCVICHGGDPLALDPDRAHATMRGGRNPSDLSVAVESCGQANCHGGYADEEQNHVDRVLKSVQATYAGGIAAVLYAFGLQSSPTARFGVHAVADNTRPLPPKALLALEAFVPGPHPIEVKFQRDCLNGGCHLSAKPTMRPYYYRSTGCAACHYLYNNDGLYRGKDPTIPHDQPGHGAYHRLTTAIPYTQCDHCHNRGNYSLKQMAFLEREDLPVFAPSNSAATPAESRRLKQYYQPMARFTRCEVELKCVDCHTAQEAMGPGHIYGSKKDAQYIQCRTCHGTPTTVPPVAQIHEANELAMRQARLNGHSDWLHQGDWVIETARGELMWGIKRMGPNHFVQMDKVTGKVYTVPLVKGSQCTQNGADQSSDYCHRCHSVAR